MTVVKIKFRTMKLADSRLLPRRKFHKFGFVHLQKRQNFIREGRVPIKKQKDLAFKVRFLRPPPLIYSTDILTVSKNSKIKFESAKFSNNFSTIFNPKCFFTR